MLKKGTYGFFVLFLGGCPEGDYGAGLQNLSLDDFI